MTKRQPKRRIRKIRVIELPNSVNGAVVYTFGDSYSKNEFWLIYGPEGANVPNVWGLDVGHCLTTDTDVSWAPGEFKLAGTGYKNRKVYPNHDLDLLVHEGSVTVDPFNGSLTLGPYKGITRPVYLSPSGGSYSFTSRFRTREYRGKTVYDYSEIRIRWDARLITGQQRVEFTSITIVRDEYGRDISYSGTIRPGKKKSDPDFYIPVVKWFTKPSRFYSDGTYNRPDIDLQWYRDHFSVSDFGWERAIRLSEKDNPMMSFEELCKKACEEARCVDINSIAFIRDFKSIFSTVEDTAEIAKGIAKPLKLAQAISSFFLSQHYGTKLTAIDTLEIASAIDKLEPGRFVQELASATSSPTDFIDRPGVHRRLFKAYIQSIDDRVLHEIDSFKEATDNLKNLILRTGYETDLLPTLSNLWDLVPYSFVVDWFLPIGRNLEQLELRNYIATLPVKACYHTDIFEWSDDQAVQVSGCKVMPSVSFKRVLRTCHSRFPVIRMDTDRNVNLSGWLGHWYEATALILQRL